MNKIEMTITNQLLMSLVQMTPFSWDEIRRAHELLGSIDKVVALCEFASQTGIANLESCWMYIRKTQIENELLRMCRP